ncbi:MAG: response regulator [Deltaproteobacteria bacterium]|nr:response regulator [Deltaproteobacteria bacterium]
MPEAPKVLIVDDEERFRTILCKVLTAKGVDAQSVGSGREALEELARTPYDVVLLDVKMPEMNGIEALSELKKRHRSVEVIMLTGHASVDVAVEIMRLGGYEYLLKPCPVDDLMDKIESAWERKKSREERLRREEAKQEAEKP